MGGNGSSSMSAGGGAAQATVQPSIDTARSVHDLEQYMLREHGISFSDSVQGMNVEVLRKGMRGLDTVMREFPELNDIIVDLDTDAPRNAYASASLKGFEGTVTLDINPSYFKHEGLIETSIRSHPGFHPKNTDAAAIMAHEAGHALEQLVGQKKYGTGWELCDAIERSKEARRIIGEAAKAVKKTPAGKQANGRQKTIDALVGEVSRYAKKNRSEALAECVSDYVTNGANAHPISQEVWNILKRELG